jgi:hypothetical protein
MGSDLKKVGVSVPDPLAFENGQLRRRKPFGLAREEVAGWWLQVRTPFSCSMVPGLCQGQGVGVKQRQA